MQLLCEGLEVIRSDRDKPTNTFTVAMEFSSPINQHFSDRDAIELANTLKRRLSGCNDGRVEIINDIDPVVRDNVDLPTGWFDEYVLPDVGIATTSYILRHGQGQHNIRRTINRLNTLHKRRQRWMFVKWVAYTVTGGVLAAWAVVQLIDKLLGIY